MEGIWSKILSPGDYTVFGDRIWIASECKWKSLTATQIVGPGDIIARIINSGK